MVYARVFELNSHVEFESNGLSFDNSSSVSEPI